MATIKVKSLLNSELQHIQSIATKNDAIEITENYVNFDLSELPKIIAGKNNGLSKRPWLFDLSDDIIDASLTYTNGASLYVNFNDLDIAETEISFTDDEIAELLATCIHEIHPDNYGLQIEKIIGRDRDGAPETEMLNVSVWDIIESGLISYSDCCVIYVANEIKKIQAQKAKNLPKGQASALAA